MDFKGFIKTISPAVSYHYYKNRKNIIIAVAIIISLAVLYFI